MEGKKVSRMHTMNEGLGGQTYRIVAGIVECEVVCGDGRRREALWSLFEA